MTVDPRKAKTKTAGADSPASKQVHRRRLLKAAALAAPLLVTLRGRPAHGISTNDHQSSLGSVGILYGPGAYVTQQDVNNNQNLKPEDVGKPVKIVNGKKKILTDPTRRDQTSVEQGKSFPANPD